MSTTLEEIEAVYFSNGWIEIRNVENSDDEWIATDAPAEVEQ